MQARQPGFFAMPEAAVYARVLLLWLVVWLRVFWYSRILCPVRGLRWPESQQAQVAGLQ